MNYREFAYDFRDWPGSQWIKADEQKQYYNSYLKRYGLKWSDVKYPHLMGGYTYSSAFGQTFGSLTRLGVDAGFGLGMVSRNIKRFYR